MRRLELQEMAHKRPLEVSGQHALPWNWRMLDSSFTPSATAQKNLILCSCACPRDRRNAGIFSISSARATGESLNFILRTSAILSICELAGKSAEVRGV